MNKEELKEYCKLSSEQICNQDYALRKLQQENKILKENAEHNDKVVDKVNWENNLLKQQNKKYKEVNDKAIEYIKNNGGYCEQYNMCSIPFNTIRLDDLLEILRGNYND